MSREESFDHAEPRLSAEDQLVVDALMESGFRADVAADRAHVDRRRVDAANNLLGLMKDYPVEDCHPVLIDATLARINQVEAEREARLNFDTHQEEAQGFWSSRRIRMPDFITVAAVILIGVGILWPTLSSVRQQSLDLKCANNMRQMALGLSNYAADNNGAIPMARAGIGGTWDTVANVLNLKPLVEGGYCDQGHINCPGHREEQVGPSYSYRWQDPEAPVQWNASRITVVLGDRNPLIDAARDGRLIPSLSVTINHGGRGQNVLANDGGVLWLDQPIIGRDNIWLPNGVEQLLPGELPREALDVFLAH